MFMRLLEMYNRRLPHYKYLKRLGIFLQEKNNMFNNSLHYASINALIGLALLAF